MATTVWMYRVFSQIQPEGDDYPPTTTYSIWYWPSKKAKLLMTLQLYRLFHMLSVSSKNKYWVSIYAKIETKFIPDDCKQSVIHYNWAQYLIWVVPFVGLFMRGMHVQLTN